MNIYTAFYLSENKEFTSSFCIFHFKHLSRYLSVFWYNCQIFSSPPLNATTRSGSSSSLSSLNFFLKCPLILKRFPIPINSRSSEAKSFDSYISSFCVLMVTLELWPPPRAAGAGRLLFLLVFPEKRVIFQCLHIQCAAQEDISEIRLDGRPVQFAVQFFQLGLNWVSSRNAAPYSRRTEGSFSKSRTLKVVISSKINTKGTLFSMENEREVMLTIMAITGDITDSVA